MSIIRGISVSFIHRTSDSSMEYEQKLQERIEYFKLIDNLKQEIADGVVDKNHSKDKLHDMIDSTGNTLLHHSVRKDDVTATRWLLDYGLDVNAQTKIGRTPLMIATKHNHEEIAKMLLKANANIQITDNSGKTVLEHFGAYLITKSTIPLALMLKLLDKCETEEDAAVELFNVKCPVYVAVLLRNSYITKLLIEKGADVNARACYQNDSALHLAVRLQDVKNVETLLTNGATVGATTFFGDTPVTYLRKCGCESADRLEILKILLDHGAMQVNAFGHAPIFFKLLRYCDKEIVRLVLLHTNFDLSLKVKGDFTLLHAIASNYHQDVFEMFQDKYLDTNISNNKGLTLLHLAALYGHMSTIRFLLERDANVNRRDKYGMTPLCYAMIRDSRLAPEDVECVELLLQYGAEVQILYDEFSMRRLPEGNVTTLFTFRGKNLMITDLAEYGKQRGDLVEPILAHLALLHITGLLKHEISTRINSSPRFKDSFNEYKQQLEEFKKIFIHESVTMFQLLTMSEKQLLVYLSDEQLVEELEKGDYKDNQGIYYRKLRLRISCAYQKMQLKVRAVEILCKIMQLSYDSYPTITDEIYKYLSKQDLQLLSQI